MASDLYYTSEFQKLSFGDKGLRIIDNGSTSLVGENFCAIQAVEFTTLSADCNSDNGDTSITSLSIGSGATIYGNFDNVSITTGKVIAYLR